MFNIAIDEPFESTLVSTVPLIVGATYLASNAIDSLHGHFLFLNAPSIGVL